jgi:predicted benzoate:H+ symporter BenE
MPKPSVILKKASAVLATLILLASICIAAVVTYKCHQENVYVAELDTPPGRAIVVDPVTSLEAGFGVGAFCFSVMLLPLLGTSWVLGYGFRLHFSSEEKASD